jgi:lipopolysaccharide export system permease protein
LDGFSLPPDEIVVGETNEKNTSIRNLLKKINFLESSGLASYKDKTYLHNRLAMPFATIIMCMLGMPFAIAVRKKSKALNIILALVLAFAYWTIMSMSLTAGQTGSLSPLLAGWGITVICAVLVITEFKLMKIY